MLEVTEKVCQLEDLLEYKESRVFIDPVYSSEKHHPKLRGLLGVYFHPLESSTGTFININHPDGFKIEMTLVKNFLSSFNNLFCLNKKEIFYHLPLKQIKDINLIYTLENFERIELPDPPTATTWLYRRLGDHRCMNIFVPLVKLYQNSNSIFNKVKNVIKNFNESPEFSFYNDDATSILFLIEKEGVRVNEPEVIKLYNIESPSLNIQDGIAYTYFNMYNNTSRPTNSFNHINFSAIPHKPEYRENFLPRNDKFLEFDFDGYHLRLLGDLLGYNFTRESAHLQLGKEYFKKDELSEQEYSTTKQINFSSIYGNPPDEYKHTPFISKLEEYTKEIWEEYSKNGFIRDRISGKVFSTKLKEMYPKKLLNYTIQSLETSNNLKTLKNILNLLKDKKSKVVMYTYDAFLIDYSETDGEGLINDVKQIMEQEGKFPSNVKISKNLVL